MKKRICLLMALMLACCAFAAGNDGIETGEVPDMELMIGETRFDACLADNDTARAFAQLLPMTLRMTELNGNEKYHYLLSPLPGAPERVGRVEAGDLMLFGDSCVVVFYESFDTPYSYTRIGRLTDIEGLAEALGPGDAEVVFSLKEAEAPETL